MFRFLLTWLYSTLLPEPRAAELTCVWQRSPGISPLRGSLRAAPIACVCGWTESSGLAESLQDSLPKLLLDGRVPLAAFFGRLLCRPSLHRQVFALPPHCCSPSSGGRQPTLLVAGYQGFQGGFGCQDRVLCNLDDICHAMTCFFLHF